MLNQETAKAARTDSGYILRAPRRMRVADAVAQYMRVPMGAGNSVPWDPLVAPYVIEPMNCLASREYDAVIFVGPARTWIVLPIKRIFTLHHADLIGVLQSLRSSCQMLQQRKIRNSWKGNRHIFSRSSLHSDCSVRENQCSGNQFRLHTAASTNPKECICSALHQFFHGNGSRCTADSG